MLYIEITKNITVAANLNLIIKGCHIYINVVGDSIVGDPVVDVSVVGLGGNLQTLQTNSQ